MQDLRAAWAAIERHPFGILLPTIGRLLLVALAAVIARAAGAGGPWWATGAWWFALRAVAGLLGAPLRGQAIAAGAVALGRAHHGARPGPMVVVVAAASLASGLAKALLGVPALIVGAALADSGWIATGLLAAGLGVLAAELLGLAVDAAFAGAPIEVVVGGRGGLGALSASLGQLGEAWPARLGLLAAAAALVTGGALLCGAGALPGYPFGDLAVLHHWLRRLDPHGRRVDG